MNIIPKMPQFEPYEIDMPPIIKSLLDNDLYTFTVGQVAFSEFPDAEVKYLFINRGKTKFPKGFDVELKKQLEYMRQLQLQPAEYEFLKKQAYFTDAYLEFLKNFRFNPDQLEITFEAGNLTVYFKGKWIDCIMWEVPFLALVSELYYKIMGLKKGGNWKEKMHIKALKLSVNDCAWMEFGTRRRFDFETQDNCVRIMKQYEGFLGTSNVLLAMKYNVPVLGTMSHQGPMAMQAKYGATRANEEWRNVWIKVHKGKLMVYLPDTFTTKVFYRDFRAAEAEIWNLRQDSGDPKTWVVGLLNYYTSVGIDSKTKTAILSDSLNVEKLIDYTNIFRGLIKIVGGIGTNFTNDCDHPALSIVIKLMEANFGDGWKPVVKLSDVEGKYTGTPEAIAETKAELHI